MLEAQEVPTCLIISYKGFDALDDERSGRRELDVAAATPLTYGRKKQGLF